MAECRRLHDDSGAFVQRLRDAGVLVDTHAAVPDAASRQGALGGTRTTAGGIGAILRELGIAVRAARFTPDRGPAVRLDVQDASLWLDPREVAALQLALTNAVRKATS